MMMVMVVGDSPLEFSLSLVTRVQVLSNGAGFFFFCFATGGDEGSMEVG